MAQHSPVRRCRTGLLERLVISGPATVLPAGCVTWSYTFRSAGAILLVSVPATIMTSLCRGLGLKMMPKRSRSYRAAPVCIISTAQQAARAGKQH